MDLISEDYRDLNRELHDRVASYGTNGYRWSANIEALISEFGPGSILDYGCGKGTLAKALAPRQVSEYDPAIPGKDAPPEPADIVACTDVLEHIEPSLLDNVLDDIRRLTKKVAFLNISTRVAAKTLKDGRNAHLIIEGDDWWRDQIERRFLVREWGVNKEALEVNCVVVPKPA